MSVENFSGCFGHDGRVVEYFRGSSGRRRQQGRQTGVPELSGKATVRRGAPYKNDRFEYRVFPSVQTRPPPTHAVGLNIATLHRQISAGRASGATRAI